MRFQKQLAKYKLLIIDELGFVSKTGAELLFEVFSQRYEGGSTLVTFYRSMSGPRCSVRAPRGVATGFHILEIGDSYCDNPAPGGLASSGAFLRRPVVYFYSGTTIDVAPIFEVAETLLASSSRTRKARDSIAHTCDFKVRRPQVIVRVDVMRI